MGPGPPPLGPWGASQGVPGGGGVPRPVSCESLAKGLSHGKVGEVIQSFIGKIDLNSAFNTYSISDINDGHLCIIDF